MIYTLVGKNKEHIGFFVAIHVIKLKFVSLFNCEQNYTCSIQSVFASISSNFVSKAENVQILNTSRFTLFGNQMFHGGICKIKLAEVSRTYLNKHFGVKIISIVQFVCK